jgi:hypothetical protein
MVQFIRSIQGAEPTWSFDSSLTKWDNGFRGLDLYLCEPFAKIFQTPLKLQVIFCSCKTCLRRTRLQVQFSCSQYDMFSSRLLECLYAWVSLTEQPHPPNELGHIR